MFEGRSFGCRRRVARRWRWLWVMSRGGDGDLRRRSGRWREAGGLFVFPLRFKRQLLGFGEVSVGKRRAGGETRLLGFPPLLRRNLRRLGVARIVPGALDFGEQFLGIVTVVLPDDQF